MYELPPASTVIIRWVQSIMIVNGLSRFKSIKGVDNEQQT
jgi:hypothetical protein